MNGHHPITRKTSELPMYPALNRLERRPELQPVKYGREPFWRAPVTPPSATVRIPSWNWTSVHPVPEGMETLTLDVNGAYLAAIGSVTIAHSHLTHTGPITDPLGPREVLPGYYKILTPRWALDGTIVSPLGDKPTDRYTWIAHPTLVLLLELLDEGALGAVEITDSWTSRVKTDFLKWAAHLRHLRADIIRQIGECQTEAAEAALRDKYDRFKEGYSSALSMMLTGANCQTRRPDWAHAVYAQFAATTWRKAWRFSSAGPLVAMGSVDTITILEQDLAPVMSRPKPPFRFDDTGITLGAFKIKEDDESTTTGRIPSDTLLEDITEEDIL